MRSTGVKIILGIGILALSGMATGCQQAVTGSLKTVHFDFDRADIRAADQGNMQSNAAWAQSHPDASLVIEGHCDERGSTEYNIASGDRRAKAAEAYLQHLGVSGARLSTISYGEERPVCTEPNEGCWWRNRRAEFVAR